MRQYWCFCYLFHFLVFGSEGSGKMCETSPNGKHIHDIILTQSSVQRCKEFRFDKCSFVVSNSKHILIISYCFLFLSLSLSHAQSSSLSRSVFLSLPLALPLALPLSIESVWVFFLLIVNLELLLL